MEEYVSKTVSINRAAEQIYTALADMSFLEKAIASAPIDELQDLKATSDTCSFKMKGIETGLQIVEREPYKTIKYTKYGNSPFDFFLWIQLKEIAPYETCMRIVLKVELNMLMKLMVGGKIKKGLDAAADRLAQAINLA
ncbi:MAG: SRPBCC family protein [Prevotellaceae bacterium]|jgi:carbon monoxide dehydrogenase subunit G|nr:SRPBCC family protein [Prevotellaceae bacterium]